MSNPLSTRTLGSPFDRIKVTAVESPGAAEARLSEATVPLTRAQLEQLAVVRAEVTVAGAVVVAVEDAEHYADRPAGAVFMPSTGETR